MYRFPSFRVKITVLGINVQHSMEQSTIDTSINSWHAPLKSWLCDEGTYFKHMSYNLKQAVRVATQYASAPCKLTISSHLFARWHLFRHAGYLRHQQRVDLWPFDRVRDTCDVGYLFANFSLPRSLCSPLRHDVRDSQTSETSEKASLNASTLRGRRHNNLSSQTKK